MRPSLARLSTAFINTFTPYPALSHLVNIQNAESLKILKIVSLVLSVATIGLAAVVGHLYCRTRYKHRYVALRPQPDTMAVFENTLKGKPALDLSSLEQFHPYHKESYLASAMNFYTTVCPYKPCGYTEFIYSDYAQGASLRTKEDYAERLEDIKSASKSYRDRYIFDNQASMKFVELGDEFWAVHPPSIGELGRLNFETIKKGTNPDRQIDPLIAEFKSALRDHNDKEAADVFMELAKIPNSLPVEFFLAAFGDVKALGVHPRIKLTNKLHELKKLCDEYKDHSENTIRTLVAFYYHKGFKNPISHAKAILNTLDPASSYCIDGDKLYKIK
jgi:hypothetical protein